MSLQYLDLIYTDQLVSALWFLAGPPVPAGNIPCRCLPAWQPFPTPRYSHPTAACCANHASQSEEAKAAYWTAHIDPTTTGGRNTGAHFAYLSKLVAKYGSGGWAVGSAVSIADATLYNMTDLHLRVWADKFAAEYPDLAAHHAQFAAIPGVKAYLDSPLCHAVANKNNLG